MQFLIFLPLFDGIFAILCMFYFSEVFLFLSTRIVCMYIYVHMYVCIVCVCVVCIYIQVCIYFEGGSLL